MKTRLVVLTLIVVVASVDPVQYDNSSLTYVNSTRSAKFFPIFSIIRFPNTACPGTGSFVGTCFTRRECKNLGGLSTGSCASKRGVCCVIQKTCGSTSNVNNTYFSNVGYPAPFSAGTSCSITIQRCNPDICQLRIDFLDLTLSPPNGDGICVNDIFTVTGSASSVPSICGENAGQHVYMDFDGNAPIIITVSTSSALTLGRRWNLKITQIACNSGINAPSGCLMYYTGATGTVRSFNYRSDPTQQLSSQNQIGTREIANLNYGVCVRVEAGFCSIQWQQTADRFSFTVTQDVIGQGDAVGNANGALNGITCNTDFVIIPNPVNAAGVPLNVDRFCGVGFIPVTTTSKPYVLGVVTNANEAAVPPNPFDIANRGFVLAYAQQLC